jgi:hypothetical protein
MPGLQGAIRECSVKVGLQYQGSRRAGKEIEERMDPEKYYSNHTPGAVIPTVCPFSGFIETRELMVYVMNHAPK